MSKIIVLQGPPACGKSTWAKQYVTENPDTVIVCRDSFREGRGIYWNPKQEKYISDLEMFAVVNAVDRGYEVIIDATNLNPKTIEKWNVLAKDKKCKIEFKEFYIPFEEAVARDEARAAAGGHSVGKKEIKRFYRTYYPERLHSETLRTVDYYRIPEDPTLPKCVICDLDGTAAWMNGRSPFDYTKVDTDNADFRMVQLLTALAEQDVHIVFLTGREGSDECREHTIMWIKKFFGHLKSQKLDGVSYKWTLIMRPQNDYRPDNIIKKELFDKHVAGKYDPICVFEDRDKVVKMWRDTGLLCCQVNYGDF